MSVNIEVKDRISRYPGRVTMTPVPGRENTYDLKRADDPVDPGTPLNKALLDQKAYTLSRDVTVYVSASGSDETGDGSAYAPYATIQKALDDLPRFLGGFTATIDIAQGDYSEEIELRDFKGGIVELGATGKAVSVASILISDCDIVQSRITKVSRSFHIEHGSRVISEVDLSLENSILVVLGGSSFDNPANKVSISGSVVGVHCGGCSRVYMDRIEGAGVEAVTGGQITYREGNVSRITATGGRVYRGAQNSTPIF